MGLIDPNLSDFYYQVIFITTRNKIYATILVFVLKMSVWTAVWDGGYAGTLLLFHVVGMHDSL